MKTRLALPALLAASLLASCGSTPDTSTHPGAAMLTLEQPSGFLGFHWKPEKRRSVLIARALDGEPVFDPSIPGGLAMPPGAHAITLSMRSPAMEAITKAAGDYARYANKMPGRHDRTLSINAIGGHDYVATARKRGDTYDYQIEDETTDKVVASTRKK